MRTDLHRGMIDIFRDHVYVCDSFIIQENRKQYSARGAAQMDADGENCSLF